MALVTTDNKHYNDIANALRSATGTEETYKPEEMAEGIGEVFDAGKQAGEQTGEDKLWRSITNNFKRRQYKYGFAYWESEYIRPTQKIYVTGYPVNTFYNCPYLKKIEAKYFDFSGSTPSHSNSSSGYVEFFRGCSNLEEIEDIKMPAGYYSSTFRDLPKLKKIEVIRFEKGKYITMFNTQWLYNCPLLEYLRIEGAIGRSITFQYAPELDVDSLKSIITHLFDFTGNGTGSNAEYANTLTLSTNSVAKLEAEGATSPNGNTWVEYIDDLKWNLATA